MKSVICSLFESHYHFGVASLINSLYKNGYRGNIYIGYKGQLPDWCNKNIEDVDGYFENMKILNISYDLHVYFCLLNTNTHLAHVKPKFMIDIMEKIEKKVDNIYYFDPDIFLKCRWSFMEEWVLGGVAIVHDKIMNDMPKTHPIRLKWKDIIIKSGLTIKREIDSYLNCGFCGVNRGHIEFLYLWQRFVNVAIEEYKLNPMQFASYDRTSPFWSIDQDSFNIASMCCQNPISEMGPEGMDFEYGGAILSHAVGTPKPWKKKYINEFLRGSPPSLADKAYWDNVQGCINLYPNGILFFKNFQVQLVSFLGRFYRRY